MAGAPIPIGIRSLEEARDLFDAGGPLVVVVRSVDSLQDLAVLAVLARHARRLHAWDVLNYRQVRCLGAIAWCLYRLPLHHLPHLRRRPFDTGRAENVARCARVVDALSCGVGHAEHELRCRGFANGLAHIADLSRTRAATSSGIREAIDGVMLDLDDYLAAAVILVNDQGGARPQVSASS